MASRDKRRSLERRVERAFLREDTMPRMIREGDPKTAAVPLAQTSTRIAWHRSKDSWSDFFLSFLFLAAPHGLWIIVLRTGIKPRTPALRALSSNPWTAREFPRRDFLKKINLAKHPVESDHTEIRIIHLGTWERIQE